MPSSDTSSAGRRGGVPRDIAAGLFLLAVAGLAWWVAADLPMGESAGIGPGFMPKSVALLIAVFGGLILFLGITDTSAKIERFPLRGPLFVLGSVVVFAASIRTLGLAVAGPLCVIISAMADKDSRPLEVLTFAVVTTTFCVVLFKYLLRLPVPLAPMILGY